MNLDTTIGGNNSNSMVTVVEADAFIDDSPYPADAWLDLTEPQKNFRLVYGAKFMASRFSWVGVPLHENQAMPYPRYVPPRRFRKGAWPFGTTAGGFTVNGVFYPVWGWEEILSIDQLSEEQLEALDTIPEDIKRAQAYIACGPIHRGIVGVTDPANGPKSKAQVKSLQLFESLSVTLAENPIQYKDSTIFDLAVKSEHFIISMLLDKYVSQVSWGYGTKIVSPLPEVESDGGGGTSPSM